MDPGLTSKKKISGLIFPEILHWISVAAIVDPELATNQEKRWLSLFNIES